MAGSSAGASSKVDDAAKATVLKREITGARLTKLGFDLLPGRTSDYPCDCWAKRSWHKIMAGVCSRKGVYVQDLLSGGARGSSPHPHQMNAR